MESAILLLVFCLTFSCVLAILVVAEIVGRFLSELFDVEESDE